MRSSRNAAIVLSTPPDAERATFSPGFTRLFTQEIAFSTKSAGLKSAGFSLAQDQIRLEGPLKELGLYTVKVHLHSEVDASLKVWVVPTVASEDGAAGKSES